MLTKKSAFVCKNEKENSDLPLIVNVNVNVNKHASIAGALELYVYNMTWRETPILVTNCRVRYWL